MAGNFNPLSISIDIQLLIRFRCLFSHISQNFQILHSLLEIFKHQIYNCFYTYSNWDSILKTDQEYESQNAVVPILVQAPEQHARDLEDKERSKRLLFEKLSKGWRWDIESGEQLSDSQKNR